MTKPLTIEHNPKDGKRYVRWGDDLICTVAEMRELVSPATGEVVAEALDSAAALLEVIADSATASGDTATWALASVMAEKARATLARSRAP